VDNPAIPPDPAEFLPGFYNLFAPRELILKLDAGPIFLGLDPNDCNPSYLGIVDTSRWTQDDYMKIEERRGDRSAVFWACPSIPLIALIRLQCRSSEPSAPAGRRLIHLIDSPASLRLMTHRHLDGRDEDAFADFTLPAGPYRVIVDEEFLWPDDGYLEWADDKILFTVTLIPS